MTNETKKSSSGVIIYNFYFLSFILRGPKFANFFVVVIFSV